MKNFITYKSKIVKCKRDSQKLQQFNVLQLLREFQSRKIHNRQNRIQQQPIHQLEIEKTLVDYLQQDCLFPQRNNKWERISLQNEKYKGKEESTMQSLCQEQSSQNQQYHQEQLNNLLENNNHYKYTPPNKDNCAKIKNKVSKTGNNLQKMRKVQSQQDVCEKIPEQNHLIKLSYQQSSAGLSNSSSFEITSKQPMQLLPSQKNYQTKQQKLNWISDITIKQQDQQKIEMLFRQEYKGLFSSTISDIQFKQGTNTTSSFQNQLQSTQGILGNCTNISKFTSILNVLNKKDNKFSQQLVKGNDKSTIASKKKKQRVIIFNKKQENQSIDKTKSCQKQVVNKSVGGQQKRKTNNKK